MSVTTDVGGNVKSEGKTGLGFYMKDWTWWAFGMAFILGICLFCVWYQQQFGHLYGMDSHDPVFDKYWMTFLYAEFVIEAILAVVIWGYLWFTRDRNLAAVGPKEELRRYFSFVMWLVVYTFAVYWAASYFAEQDGSWHQVVARDTSFTPSHIMIFYMSFPLYIIMGVATYIYAHTRLPEYHRKGVSLPHLLAVLGPFMILPNVGLNEWGHAFWFMEELFTAPLHWGFVILGWAGLALGGVLMQIVLRVNEILPQVQNQ